MLSEEVIDTRPAFYRPDHRANAYEESENIWWFYKGKRYNSGTENNLVIIDAGLC